jgi:hypothetical protein
MVMDAGFDNAGCNPGGSDAGGQNGADGKERGSRAGPAAAMPDQQQVARDWITLWQTELSAIAADAEMHEFWRTMMALWSGSFATILRDAVRPPAYGKHERADGRSWQAGASRAAPAAAAPDARDAEITRLAQHVGDRAVDPKRRPRRKPGK